jgi:hypothetical protein
MIIDDKIIEAVAKRICEHLGWNWNDHEYAASDTRERCREAATGAIAAYLAAIRKQAK